MRMCRGITDMLAFCSGMNFCKIYLEVIASFSVHSELIPMHIKGIVA